METEKELVSLSNLVLFRKLGDETYQIIANGPSTQLLLDAFSSDGIGKFYTFMFERKITYWDEVLPMKYIQLLEGVGIHHGLTIKKRVSDNDSLYMSLGFSFRIDEPVNHYLNLLELQMEYLENKAKDYIDMFGLNESAIKAGYPTH